MLDGAAIVTGAAVASIHVRGLIRDDATAPGWLLIWGTFAWVGLTAWLIWKRNRFGLLLLLAVTAFHLGLLESTNYWDYLLDPVYSAACLVALSRRLVSAGERRLPQEAP